MLQNLEMLQNLGMLQNLEMLPNLELLQNFEMRQKLGLKKKRRNPAFFMEVLYHIATMGQTLINQRHAFRASFLTFY